MHEWALAEAVISTVSQIAEKERLREVTEVRIKIGELQQIELDILKFALLQLETPKLRKAKFNIDTINAELKCRVCGYKWVFGKETLNKDVAEVIHFVPDIAHVYIKCPECGSPDFEILQGRGIWLESVKGMR